MLKIKNRSSKWSTGYGSAKCASRKLLAFTATLKCAFRNMQIELRHMYSPPFRKIERKVERTYNLDTLRYLVSLTFFFLAVLSQREEEESQIFSRFK